MIKTAFDESYEINDYLYSNIYCLTSPTTPLLQNELVNLLLSNRYLNKKRIFIQSENSLYESHKEHKSLTHILSEMKNSGLYD